MGIYELAVCVKDEDDLASGHKRKKQGDVIVARARKRKSTTEIDHYEMQNINGKMKNVPIMKDIDEDFHWGDMEINSHLIVVADIDDTQSNLDKKFICKSDAGDKRAYKIDLNDLKTNYCPELDIAKVEDKKIIYQPFKKASKLVSKFDNIQVKDVDCGLSAESEIIVPKDVNDLIYSKDKSQHVVIKNELVKEVV